MNKATLIDVGAIHELPLQGREKSKIRVFNKTLVVTKIISFVELGNQTDAGKEKQKIQQF